MNYNFHQIIKIDIKFEFLEKFGGPVLYLFNCLFSVFSIFSGKTILKALRTNYF